MNSIGNTINRKKRAVSIIALLAMMLSFVGGVLPAGNVFAASNDSHRAATTGSGGDGLLTLNKISGESPPNWQELINGGVSNTSMDSNGGVSLFSNELDVARRQLEGVKFSVIGVDSNNSNVNETIYTDEFGNFSLSNLPYGKYKVTEVKAPLGYEKLTKSSLFVQVTKDRNHAHLNFQNKEIERDINYVKDWTEGSEKIRTEITTLYETSPMVFSGSTTTMVHDGLFDWNSVKYFHPNGSFVSGKMDEEFLTEKDKEYYVYEVLPQGEELQEALAEKGDVFLTMTNDQIYRDITVQKDFDGQKVDSVKVDLLRDGDVVETITLNENNNWTHTFEKLARYSDALLEGSIADRNGNAYEYTVVEKEMDNYKSTVTGNEIDGFVIKNDVKITGDMEKGFTVTNTKLDDEIARRIVKVNKFWEGKELDEVTVKLLANGEEYSKAKLTKENDFGYVFENLPVVKKAGDKKEIKYTVEEVDVKGYKSKVKGDMNKGFAIMNIEVDPKDPVVPADTKVSVSKKWDGEKLNSVRVELFADGDYIRSVRLNERNNWKHTFDNLPNVNNVKDNKAVKYTVKEVSVRGYESRVTGNMKDGFVITNKQIDTPVRDEKINIVVTKTWDGDQKDETTIDLQANGKVVDRVTFKKGGVMKHTFKYLPKYDENNKEIVYSVNEVNAWGYTVDISGNTVDGFVVKNTQDEVDCSDCDTTEKPSNSDKLNDPNDKANDSNDKDKTEIEKVLSFKEKYEKIDGCMSYEDVTKLLGGKVTMVPESEGRTTYRWDDNGDWITVSFEKDFAVEKSASIGEFKEVGVKLTCKAPVDANGGTDADKITALANVPDVKTFDGGVLPIVGVLITAIGAFFAISRKKRLTEEQ